MEKNKESSISKDIANKKVTLKNIMKAYEDRNKLKTPKMKILADAANMLKSFQHSLNEDLVQKERYRSKLINDIYGLEVGICEIINRIKRAETLIKENGDKVEDFVGPIKPDEMEDKGKGKELPHEEFEKELEKEKQEICNKMDLKKKKNVELVKMEIAEKIIDAKTKGKKMCLTCGEVKNELFICENCNDAYYCNEKCQTDHWFIHQHYCRRTDRFKHKQQQQQEQQQ